MTTRERNAIFAKYMALIRYTIRKNYPLIRVLYDSPEDAFQDLALELLLVIAKYRPDMGIHPKTYYTYRLWYRLLSRKRAQKPHGIVGMADYTIPVLSLDQTVGDGDGLYYEIPYEADYMTALTLEEAFAPLSQEEREVAIAIASGLKAWNRCPRDTYLNMRRKLVGYFADIRS